MRHPEAYQATHCHQSYEKVGGPGWPGDRPDSQKCKAICHTTSIQEGRATRPREYTVNAQGTASAGDDDGVTGHFPEIFLMSQATGKT
jgi:hypothetical protein